MAKLNPVVDEWLIQADFQFQIELAVKSKEQTFVVKDLTESKEKSDKYCNWPTSAFEVLDGYPIKFPSNVDPKGHWLFPTRLCYPAYDAVQAVYDENWLIRFVNTNRNRRHELKADDLKKFITVVSETLRNHKTHPLKKDQDVVCEFVFLLPDGMQPTQVPQSDQLAFSQSMKSLSVTQSLRYCSFKRTSGFLSFSLVLL
jgi:hypothetical protein